MNDETAGSSDTPMIQMAKMHGTFHVTARVIVHIPPFSFIEKLFLGSCSSHTSGPINTIFGEFEVSILSDYSSSYAYL